MKFLKEENELKRMQSFNRKRKKGQSPFVTYNAGDVEKGMAIFNKNTTLNTGSTSTESSGESSSTSSGASQGMGESLTEGAVKEIAIEMEEFGGKGKYLAHLRRLLNNKQRALIRTADKIKKSNIEKDIEKIENIIGVVTAEPQRTTTEIEKDKQQLDKLERELVVDRETAWNFRPYQYKKIDNIKQRLKGDR